jgi:AraC-like DNA-binding protein
MDASNECLPLGRIEPLEALFGAAIGQRNIGDSPLRQYVFLHSGCLTFEVDGFERRLRPGSLLILPAGVSCRVVVSGSLRGTWIGASESLLNAHLMPIMGGPTPEYWLSFHLPQLIEYWVGPKKAKARNRVQEELEMAREHLRQDSATAVFAYVYVVLLGDIHRSNFRGILMSTGASSRADLGIVTGFRALIEKNFRQHLAVDGYASLLGISAARLTRTCRVITNRSPLDLIQERMFREARHDLLCSERSVAEIAYSLGFEEPSYFSRRFKDMVGTTPGDFREKQKAIH